MRLRCHLYLQSVPRPLLIVIEVFNPLFLYSPVVFSFSFSPSLLLFWWSIGKKSYETHFVSRGKTLRCVGLCPSDHVGRQVVAYGQYPRLPVFVVGPVTPTSPHQLVSHSRRRHFTIFFFGLMSSKVSLSYPSFPVEVAHLCLTVVDTVGGRYRWEDIRG